MLITVDNQTALRLLRIYGINMPVTDERLLAQHDVRSGIPVTIDGVCEPEAGRMVRLKIAGRRSGRACPVSESDAQGLIAEFTADQVLPDEARMQRTLLQLLMKCSKLYQDSGVSELHLVLYLTLAGYRTHAVYMLRTRSVSIRKRLSAAAPE